MYLYADWNYEGEWIRLTESTDWVGEHWNDITSSVRIVGPCRVTLFGDNAYSGGRATLVGPALGTPVLKPEVCPRIGDHDIGVGGDVWPGEYACRGLYASARGWGLNNDEVSSVSITPLDRYDKSVRLVWPVGYWASAVPGGSATIWRFNPDGTFVRTSGGTPIFELRGNFDPASATPTGPVGTSPMYGTPQGPGIRLTNISTYVNGKYAGPDPDQLYGLAYEGENQLVLMTGEWSAWVSTTYTFHAD